MAGLIQCPVCGENNSSDAEYCQKCNSPLLSQDSPFKPGELPNKKKNTAELEPILPQWLRDAREQSRQTSQDEDAGMQTLKAHAPEQPAPNVDFLAGLKSHTDDNDEDETPDWLASITGVTNKPKKTESEAADVRWVEMGGKDDFAQDAPAQDAETDTPSWLANIQSQPKSEKDELTDWFKEAASPSSQESNWLDEPAAKNKFTAQNSEPLSSSDTPDWLRQMQANESAAPSQPAQSDEIFNSNDDTPDWLKSMSAADSAQNNQAPAGQTLNAGDDAPDWLKRMDEPDPAGSGTAFSAEEDAPAWLQQPASPQADDDVPNWLNTLDAQQKVQASDPVPFSEPGIGGGDAGFTSSEDTPDWLKNMQAEEEPKAPPLKGTSPLWLRDESAAEAEDINVPSWLASTPPMAEQQPPAFESSAFESKEEQADLGDIPNWLKAAAPQSSIFSEPAAEPDQTQTFSSDTPDWLSAFKSVEGSQPASPFAGETQPQQELPSPAFTENSFESLGDNSLFNETPDWLSNAAEPPAADSPLTSNDAGSIDAGELPSWVQAMRPVDSGSRSADMPTDQTLESRGALAGLQGVLPAVPGFTPSSKPKAYSILLQATDEQKSQALLLEQILAAEAEPQPIASYAPLAASRSLRWFIAVMVFGIVAFGLRTTSFSIPSIPLDGNNSKLNPLNDALYVVQHIPDNAPVLVVMDYQPSRAGELEAAALPVFDQMDLLHHPNLYFVSTNEMGSILTERLVSLSFTFNSMKSLRDRYQESGQSLINLGYLPGGEMGVRAFVQNPFLVMPQDVAGSPSRLQENGISINQFVAIIVMTDSADSGRAWIEQTQIAQYPFPLVFITSSQAGPMLQPYYDSGQIKGIVNGLYDGVVVEVHDAKRFATAQGYWGAYNMGMWLAMPLLILGGLWNLALGTRERTAAREAQ